MARPGITYYEVANAAQELIAQGKNPTIENIRLLTGTGSSSTIAQHLKAWKNKQDQTKLLCLKENLPEEIVLTMKGLWERVMDQAEEKISIIKQEYDQAIALLQDQNKQLSQENTTWAQKFGQMKQEKEDLCHQQSVLLQNKRELEDEKLALTVKTETLTNQLEEKQIHVDELHRLNKQVQENLEHYREASREQRMQDQQRHEQVEMQLEQTIQKIKQELTLTNQHTVTLQQELEQMRFAKTALQNQYEQLTKQQEIIQAELQHTQKEMIQHAHAEQHWQKQYQKAQEKADEQNTAWINLQTQFALTTQKLSDLQIEFKEIAEQNKLLSHEKWILAQEKAQLIGQLKQFEKIAVA